MKLNTATMAKRVRGGCEGGGPASSKVLLASLKATCTASEGARVAGLGSHSPPALRALGTGKRPTALVS